MSFYAKPVKSNLGWRTMLQEVLDRLNDNNIKY